MRRNEIISLALFALLGCLLLAGTASAVEPRPLVYSKTQSEWPGEGRPQREWGGLYAAADGERRQLTFHPGDREPNVSRSGEEIVFVREGDIYAMDADGSDQRQLTSGPDLDERPQISPGIPGAYVLFTRRPAFGEPRHLFTVYLTGGEPRQLTSGSSDDSEPSFSPDGRLIVFVRGLPGPEGGEFDGNAELFSIRPSADGLTRLTRTPRDELHPRYVAHAIVFQRRNAIHTPLAIFSIPRYGGKARPLVRRKSNSRVGAVSPDGRLLLFNSNGIWKKRLLRSGSWSRARRLTSGGSENLVFSPNGRRVAGTFANTSSEVSPFYVLTSIDVSTGLGQGAIESWEAEEPNPVQTSIGSVLGW
jgi:Tol biopolymer transport system component